MTGTVCLQGGGEFSLACREMDEELVRLAGGRVVVTALAGVKGRDYYTATANGVRHFKALGARDVVAAPDVREDPSGALIALETARLIVLPGGSPTRLLAAVTTTPVGQAISDLLAEDGVVMGASAGAMVLCPWTVLPDHEEGLTVAPGLGLVGSLLVAPHWSGPAGRESWLGAAKTHAPEVVVLGIPEESGVLIRGGVLTAVGRSSTTVVTEGRDLAPGQTWEQA